MLSSTSTAFGTAATNSDANGFTDTTAIDSALRQRALAEEEAILSQYKAKVQSQSSTPSTISSSAVNNPFLSPTISDKASTPRSNSSNIDFFTTQQPVVNKASDDLLLLNNPFSNAYETNQQSTTQNNIMLQQHQSNLWTNNGNKSRNS